MVKILDKAEAFLPTKKGDFKIVAFKTDDNQSHAALIKGSISGKSGVLVRVHSECLTGDVMHSNKCDCGEQLDAAMEMIEKEGLGVILYLRQEGRGIGLFNKVKAYKLQMEGRDTVQANIDLGFKADQRDYSIGAMMLRELGLTSVRLITNNPRKIEGLGNYGIEIKDRIPLQVQSNLHNKKYLETKQEKLGHMFEKIGFVK